MQPKQFEEANSTFAEDQPGVNPLPAFRNPSPQGEVVSCWELTDEEKQRVQETGEIWVVVTTFNQPLQPMYLAAKREEVFETNAPTDEQS